MYLCDSEPGFLGMPSSATEYNLRSIDAACFREWGIDLLKLDACNPKSYRSGYQEQILKFWRGALEDDVILYNCRFGCMATTECGNIFRCPHRVNLNKNGKVPDFCEALSDVARSGIDIKPYWSVILRSIGTRFGRGQISKPGMLTLVNFYG
jgi:hypothetical protein